MGICEKCGGKLEKEYVQSAKGGYDFEVHTYCTECDYEIYEE